MKVETYLKSSYRRRTDSQKAATRGYILVKTERGESGPYSIHLIILSYNNTSSGASHHPWRGSVASTRTWPWLPPN